MSSITSAASRWPLVASSSRLAASRRRADAGSYTISGGAGGATRTASARRTHSRASINDGRGARRGGDGQHQGADRLKAPQPDAGDSTEEQAGQRTPDAGRDGSAGGCARPNFCDSGSPTAISTNTGAGVLAARRAKCAASESTASHASHPQLVEIVIRDAAGFRANSADHRSQTRSRVGPAKLHSSRSSCRPHRHQPLRRLSRHRAGTTSVTRWTAALSRTSVGSSSMCMAGRE